VSPTPTTHEHFERLVDAGRRLAQLHVTYESVEPYPLDVQLKPGTGPSDRDTWHVQKMKWPSKTDHSAIIYNGKVTVAGIPEGAER
jgi:predicted helicase